MFHSKNTIFILTLFICFANMLWLNGCAVETHYLKILNEYETDESNGVKTGKIVFTANIIPTTLVTDAETKALYTPDTLPLDSGRFVDIYIYKDGETPETDTYLNYYIYRAYSAGLIEPYSKQYDIDLPEGTYNLYALVEANTPDDKNPSFQESDGKGGLMDGLANGQDYCWFYIEDISVSDDEIAQVNMVFNHIATQLQFQILATDKQTVDTVTGHTVQCPDPSDCTLQLATGLITQSTTLLSTSDMINLHIEKEDYFELYVTMGSFTTSSTDFP